MPNNVLLAQIFNLDGGCHIASNHVGKRFLGFSEIPDTSDQKRDDEGNRNGEPRPVDLGIAANDGPPKSIDHCDHRVERIKQAPALRHNRATKADRGNVKAKLDNKWDDVTKITVLGVERREPEACAERGGQREQKKRRKHQHTPRRIYAIPEHHGKQEQKRDEEVHQANHDPNDPKENKKEPTFEDIDQETLDREFDHEFVGLEDEPTSKYKFDDEFGDYETVRAELIRNNRPESEKSAHSNQLLLWPDIDPIPDDTGRVEPTEQDYAVDPNQMELDFSNNDQLKEDLDKWNDWVDTATKAAEEEDAKENDIITGIGSAKGTFSNAQKKTSYITKVENKQVRKKTDV